MANVIDQVLAFCDEDEQLSSLAADHPLLLSSLENIPALTVADVLSVLAAVENEQFQLVQEVERRRSFEYNMDSDCQVNDIDEGFCMYAEDLLGHWSRAHVENLALHKEVASQRASQRSLASTAPVAVNSAEFHEELRILKSTMQAE